jgi:hypothetical protein
VTDAGTVDVDYDKFNRVTSVNGVLTGATDPDTVTYTWNSGYSQLDQIDGAKSYQQAFDYDALE